MGGVDANGKAVRKTSRSLRPSSILPSAWDDFTPKQKEQTEKELEATRTKLKTEIDEIENRANTLRGSIALAICSGAGSGSIVIRDLKGFIASLKFSNRNSLTADNNLKYQDLFEAVSSLGVGSRAAASSTQSH